MDSLQKGLMDLRAGLNSWFLERDELIDGTLVALLAKQHLFMLGAPGTGKSDICQAICGAIEDAKFFKLLMGKFTTPEEVFGPYRLTLLKEDRYIRNYSNKLPDAHIAFLDEIWKSSTAIGNTLLTISNEREFHNGDEIVKVPLMSIFAASNELPQNDELAAMYDRFTLKYEVHPTREESSFRALFNGLKRSSLSKISLQELQQAQEKAQSLEIPNEVTQVYKEIKDACAKEGIQISDRKVVQSASAIRAFAYLMGHEAVEVEDLMILKDMLWSDPEQARKVASIVGKHANPVAEKITSMLEQAEEVYNALKEGKEEVDPAETFNKIKQIQKSLEKIAQSQNKPFVKNALEKVKKFKTIIAQEQFNIDFED